MGAPRRREKDSPSSSGTGEKAAGVLDPIGREASGRRHASGSNLPGTIARAEVGSLPSTPNRRIAEKQPIRRESRTPVKEAIVTRPPRDEPRMTFIAPKANPEFQARLREDLARFRNAPVLLDSKATNAHDGRKDRLVLVLARTADGAPMPGVLARLLQNGELRDHARTDKRGVAILTLAPSHAHHEHAHDSASAKVEVLQPGRDAVTRDVNIPMGRQHRVVEFVLEAPIATEVPVTTMDTTSAPQPLRKALDRVVDLMDNPLDRLPADFSTELCEDLHKFLGPVEDPILGGVAGTDDFRQRRIPLVKRVTIPRLGELHKDHTAPRRYLVRVRQEWTFLGYTLGELAEVDALDPGAVLKETTSTVDRALQSATRAVDTFAQHAAESTVSHLDSHARIENVTRIATSVTARAAAGGFGFALPFIAGGAVGASARVSSTTAVRTRTDTSLEVNSSIHVAKSLVNEAVSTLQSTQRDVRRTVSKALQQVSPLLSRVTNLLRWTLYENYMVCTHVEDVLEVEAIQIADLYEPFQNGLLFTDEQIVDLRRIFEPNLLEPSLRRRFDVLAAAVDARRGAELPIVAVHVTADYTTRYGASLTVRMGPDDDETTLDLRHGAGRVRQTIRLNRPHDDSAITGMTLDVANHSAPNVAFPWIPTLPDNSTQVTRIELAFETASGFVRRLSIPMGSTLSAEGTNPGSASPTFTIPPPAVFTQADPLVVHVNKNKTHYFGLLAQAALIEPALRDDMPHFDAFNSSHEIWSLPIVGFEGNKALVVKEANKTLDEVKALLEDPGAATLVQLAAPGAYAEALQGLLKLAVDTEKVHPALLPAPAPAMPPLTVVDLTGKTIPLPVGGSPTPTPTPVPLPSP